jgi:hypothetical protein
MRYIKLYEDFNSKDIKTKDILEDIVSLDYILSDEDKNTEYFLTEKMASGKPNRFLLGTSANISTKIDDSFDELEIYKIQIYFNTDLETTDVSDEYFNKLKGHLEDLYDVKVVRDRPYTKKKINNFGEYSLTKVNCISVIIERQPDDYIYFEDL